MKGEDIFMSNINLCKGDIVCRYWSEFTVFTVRAIGIFGLGIALF